MVLRIQTPRTRPELVFVLVLLLTGDLGEGVKSDRGDAQPLHRPHDRQRLQRECLHRGWQGGLSSSTAARFYLFLAQNWEPTASALEALNTRNVSRMFQFKFVMLCLGFASPSL